MRGRAAGHEIGERGKGWIMENYGRERYPAGTKKPPKAFKQGSVSGRFAFWSNFFVHKEVNDLR